MKRRSHVNHQVERREKIELAAQEEVSCLRSWRRVFLWRWTQTESDVERIFEWFWVRNPNAFLVSYEGRFGSFDAATYWDHSYIRIIPGEAEYMKEDPRNRMDGVQ